jgi:hypothetical protein
MTLDEAVAAASAERLKHLVEMPDHEIRTDLIPERRFDLALARERRKAGWTPGKTRLQKAS